jgi:hypothetical protein
MLWCAHPTYKGCSVCHSYAILFRPKGTPNSLKRNLSISRANHQPSTIEIQTLKENWGFLLIDSSNGFNEQNQMEMLWAVRHEWPSGARFVLNCYKHWAVLLLRGNDGHAVFIFSKEGMTQGDPLSMFLRNRHPASHQPTQGRVPASGAALVCG